MYITHIEKRTVGILGGTVIEAMSETSYRILRTNSEVINFSIEITDKGNAKLLQEGDCQKIDKVKITPSGVCIVKLFDGEVLSTSDEQPISIVDLKSLAKVGTEIPSVFKEINQYFASKSAADQKGIYEALTAAINLSLDYKESKEDFDRAINTLYSFIEFDDILEMVKQDDELAHPETKDQYGTEEPDNGITYITKDYMDLTAFAIYLRPIAVVWCCLMSVVGEENGSADKKRELEILKISKRYSFLDLPVLDRLERFVETLAKDNVVSLGAIMDGLGSEDLKPWLMSYALLRRSSLFQFSRKSELRSGAMPANIVSNIYNFLIGKITNAVTSFGSSYRLKRMKKMHGSNDDKNASFGDNYKITDEVPEGTIALYDRAAMDMYQYHNIEPSISLNKLETRYKRNRRLFDKEEISLENYILVQFIMDDVFPMKLIPSMSLDGSGKELIMMFTAAQLILEKWGLYDLSALVFASSIKIPYNKSYDNIKSRLKADYTEALSKSSPVILIKDLEKEKDPLPETIRCIDALAVEWGSKLWEPYTTEVSLDKLTMKKLTSGFLIQKEIRNDLAQLFIKLNRG